MSLPQLSVFSKIRDPLKAMAICICKKEAPAFFKSAICRGYRLKVRYRKLRAGADHDILEVECKACRANLSSGNVFDCY